MSNVPAMITTFKEEMSCNMLLTSGCSDYNCSMRGKNSADLLQKMERSTPRRITGRRFSDNA